MRNSNRNGFEHSKYYYKITTDNEVIKEGSVIGCIETTTFQLFSNYDSDIDCDHNDSATFDKCLPTISTCTHKCEECNNHGQMVFVNATLAYVSSDATLTFELIDENDIVKLKGGLHTTDYRTNHLKVCLADGSYNFAIYSEACSNCIAHTKVLWIIIMLLALKWGY